MRIKKKSTWIITAVLLGLITVFLLLMFLPKKMVVPQEERWGIYSLDLDSSKVELLFSSDTQISFLDLNHAGDAVVFSQESNDDGEESEEIFSLQLSDGIAYQLTDNEYRDVYPVWSPDDQQIAYLSWRSTTMGIYLIDVDGGNERVLYDSEYHDADLDWEDRILFTRNSQVWIMDTDGSNVHPVTNAPHVGEESNMNVPFGDYDPRLKPNGSQILFSRLVDDGSLHGNYDFFLIDTDGASETRLTDSGFSQGIAQWSTDGDMIVYSVAAIDDEGKYDIYLMDSDGSNNHSITPEYFPETFLCYCPAFFMDNEKIIFIGEWWE